MELLNAYLYGGAIGALVSLGLSALVLRTVIRKRLEERSATELRDRKDQFIALTSHYILNPVSIIQAAIATLQEKQTSATLAERQQLYDAIERGQQRLWIMAEQLAIVGEVDQGDLVLNISVASLVDTISAAIAAVVPFAREKKVKIKFDYGAENFMQTEARFDARRLRQAIIAVLDNAIKFSLEDGVVQVRLQLESNIFIITVEDQGIGMPDEIVSHISEKFFRGTGLYNYDYQGLGLGLHIAQAIIRLHHGSITFTSKPQRGTITTIEFPNL
ncbi:HAMP domain-containing histidine kinase [Patescibacteria group bacterium]|nr:HAMP domain-containing histidine kinase [Patescibacteria group bacterium]